MQANIHLGPEDVDEVELPLRLSTSDIDALGRVADSLRASRQSVSIPPPGPPNGLLGLAQSIYRLRRLRDDVFGDVGFANPRWDLLLDLFIAREKGAKISISSACIGAAAPATTALRHLSGLVQDGLVRRVVDTTDGRIVHVVLTDDSHVRMGKLLSSWAGGAPGTAPTF